jgi:hypothetical protein
LPGIVIGKNGGIGGAAKQSLPEIFQELSMAVERRLGVWTIDDLIGVLNVLRSLEIK